MRKRAGHNFILFLCAASCAVFLLSGCGHNAEGSRGNSSIDSSKEGKKTYSEPLTIDVFDSQANYQGVQQGWFAKIVKDRFNMELNVISPNIAGGGETLFETRMASGNVGDLIITNADSGRLKKLADAGLVLDMSAYLDGQDYLQADMDAIENCSALAGQDGIWAVPSEISNQPASSPCEALEPTSAPSLRYDLYKAAGSPELTTMEDLLPVLSVMQEMARKEEGRDDIYAFSLFSDWDGVEMQNAMGLATLYGYTLDGFAMLRADGAEVQSLIDSDGIYIRCLRFLNKAMQEGLVDPSSRTQNYDSAAGKYSAGSVLYSFWPWLGTGAYNTTERVSEGKGFATVAVDDMKCLSYGSMPYGRPSLSIMIGSGTKDPQRMVDFIGWLYSPEGIMATAQSSGGSCGPEGLTWETGEDGNCVLTDFGADAFINLTTDLSMPEGWGDGTWQSGISVLNFRPAGLVDINTETGESYNYQRWDDYQQRVSNTLEETWKADHNGADSAIAFLEKQDQLLVLPGTDYASPAESADTEAIRDQCGRQIQQYSWDMVYAGSDEEFDELLSKMQTTVAGLGYNQVFEEDYRNSLVHAEAIREVLEDTSS